MGLGLKVGDYVKPYSYAGSVWKIISIVQYSRRSRILYEAEFAYGRQGQKGHKETAFKRDQIVKVPRKQLQKHMEELIWQDLLQKNHWFLTIQES